MKNLILMVGCFLLVILLSCEKEQTDFQKFFDGHEIVYTGSVGDVVDRPGNLRTMLKWKSSTDPSIVKYVIFYNKTDSTVVNITEKTDSVSALIENLEEFVYSFTIYSYDAKGNKSIPKVINGVKIYGDIYRNALLNRAYNADDPFIYNADESVTLNFNVPDTVNVGTLIKYTNTSGSTIEKTLSPGNNSIVLPNYKLNTEVQYRSSYMPERNSLDIFTVPAYSVFPKIYKYVKCDKSLFKEYTLQNDVGTLDESPVRKLWDGSEGPQGYPNIFHSRDTYTLPHTITFDMGKVYADLGLVEETGRNCCHNPDQFEIWGIADISNAATTLPANDAGWKNEAIAKGWTLLTDAVRTDDGGAAKKFRLIDNPPPVRYIRIRIKHTANNESKSSNMSEITFWERVYTQ